jgi:hypothetical protein
LFWRSGKVKVVVLDPEVLAERQDIPGNFVVVRIGLILLLDGKPVEEQRKIDREVR